MRKKNKKTSTHSLRYLAGILFLLTVFLFVLLALFNAALGPKGAIPKVQAQVIYPLIPTNLLSNNSLEVDSNADRVPNGWDVVPWGSDTDHIDCSVSHSGKCSFRIQNNGVVQKTIRQKIAVSARAGSKITISAWSKAADVLPANISGAGVYWAQVVLYNNDGTVTYGAENEIPGKGNILEFDKGTHDFQMESKTFISPKSVRGVEVLLRFSDSGAVWFDDVALSIEE